MIRASRKSLLRVGVWTALLVAASSMPAVASVAGQGAPLPAQNICVSAEVSEPILLPDGSWHPAGLLTLCRRGDYSPVAAFHETYVNRMPLGLFLSHQCVSEGPAEAEPFMMFYRQADGRLRLYAYALPSGDHMTNYFLEPPAGGKAASRSARPQGRTARVPIPLSALGQPEAG